MNALLAALAGLLVLVAWAALGCYALRDFAYSRLEELCERHGVPDRLRSIMMQQDQALLVLEVLLTVATLGASITVCRWLGGPLDDSAAEIARVVFEYVLSAIAVVIAADLIPWLVTRVAAERFLFRFWPVIQFLLWTFQPLVGAARGADLFAHRLIGRGAPESDDASLIGEEIRTVVDEGRREGVLEQGAGVMIERVMEFQDEDVGAIMTPRTDMICIPVDASLEEARQQLLASGHSRVPVIGESTDDIIGILYAKDLLKALEPDRKPGEPVPVLRDIVREPLHVPLTTEIPSLLELLKREHVHIAIVSDEYGGVAGLVTMEDIVEEIVGEIADEYDTKQQPADIVVLSDTATEVDARVHLDDLNARFHYDLPEDQAFDTIGGFLFSLMGRVPIEGETIEWNGLRFTVLAADQRKALRLRIDTVTEPSTTTPRES
uniref:HlyC/CorC family transporter n=1 Tax=Schlesneria paludicola TaxID=360056 RepID=A0A7C2K2X7_9PLAN